MPMLVMCERLDVVNSNIKHAIIGLDTIGLNTKGLNCEIKFHGHLSNDGKYLPPKWYFLQFTMP